MGFTTTYCGKKLHNLEIKLSSYFHINLYTHYNGQNVYGILSTHRFLIVNCNTAVNIVSIRKTYETPTTAF